MVSLSISKSEWNVLARQLILSGINPDNVNKIINEHKKILNDFKEKLEYTKAVELAKFKKDLDKKSVRNRENKILKFENQKDEELTKKFREKWFQSVQKIEGKF